MYETNNIIITVITAKLIATFFDFSLGTFKKVPFLSDHHNKESDEQSAGHYCFLLRLKVLPQLPGLVNKILFLALLSREFICVLANPVRKMGRREKKEKGFNTKLRPVSFYFYCTVWATTADVVCKKRERLLYF